MLYETLFDNKFYKIIQTFIINIFQNQ